MNSETTKAVAALTDEILALSWAIELLRKKPSNYVTILDKCEQSIERCQTLIASLGVQNDEEPSVTIQ